MREIKFRAKASYIDEWRYGSLVEVEGKLHIVENKDLYECGHHIRQESDRPTWIKEETLGQFTGLYDKNGKEIYEGDIVRYCVEDTRCVNPDCEPYNYIYEPILRKKLDEVSFSDGMFIAEEEGIALAWCGIVNLQELRDNLHVSEENNWCDNDGNIIDESVLGIEVIGNIHEEGDRTMIQEYYEEIQSLYYDGWNPEDIAEELGLDECEVMDYCANLLMD